MKTLVFFGSPRLGGDTAAMLAALLEPLGGEVFTVDAYRSGIAPCNDCRACHTRPGCSIRDGMDEVYAQITSCDIIVVASPVYFSELTGPLLSVMSRLQTLYAARMFRGETRPPLSKRGAVLLCGGGSGGISRAAATAESLLRMMGARCLGIAAAQTTDSLPAARDGEALSQKLGNLLKNS